jgi:hypothetical protein
MGPGERRGARAGGCAPPPPLREHACPSPPPRVGPAAHPARQRVHRGCLQSGRRRRDGARSSLSGDGTSAARECLSLGLSTGARPTGARSPGRRAAKHALACTRIRAPGEGGRGKGGDRQSHVAARPAPRCLASSSGVSQPYSSPRTAFAVRAGLVRYALAMHRLPSPPVHLLHVLRLAR